MSYWGWARRNMLRRRRITAQIKKLPEPAQVQETMASIQHAIITGKYTEDEVRNGDESGMFFGAPPKYRVTIYYRLSRRLIGYWPR